MTFSFYLAAPVMETAQPGSAENRGAETIDFQITARFPPTVSRTFNNLDLYNTNCDAIRNGRASVRQSSL
jgi:hypothetical protein